ncbi:beta-aspartyl-peptidase (threonine type) [Variovorax boronicumulans]|uniref:isoaspartyl peptidase/L-asparaginase family protein n=1 Tax=Variovorax boronicumulans TaxID=436515 RepID=UPI002786C619|nr:isoaspartyl peptidase/L-asparaginase [Variovorax boronicumulans]MDP9995594.1 beta-aspartyl-peptidase (threonine type) [Variovorax boronicumulans]MDQ0007163.1 beta-aspartyl-peptidase (threonine type) [Variovorax boronicumulans]
MKNTTPVIAIHGGAGTISAATTSTAQAQAYHDALRNIVRAAQAALLKGASALDATCLAVELLEECPLFNAGHGAVFTHEETHELDAAVMDGATLAAGAIAGVCHVRRPVRAARAVLEDGAHVLLAGAGAEAFARDRGLEMVEPFFFSTEARRQQLYRVRDTGRVVTDHEGAAMTPPLDEDKKFGTVGAVALDMHGHLAAATSTGGMTNKRVGRIGDSPLIGSGTYADDRTAAISCTGSGEMFIRVAAAHDICARMAYGGATLEAATHAVVHQSLPAIGGTGGLIAVDRHGNLSLAFNTEGMYRGHARGDEAPITAIFA